MVQITTLIDMQQDSKLKQHASNCANDECGKKGDRNVIANLKKPSASAILMSLIKLHQDIAITVTLD